MNMRPVILSLLLVCSTCVGCLSDNSDSEGITLIVHFEEANGTIIESYIDGNLDSTTGVTIRFDFSNTASGHQLVAFGVDISNDGPNLAIHPDESSIIDVEFTEHGIHDLVAEEDTGQKQGGDHHPPCFLRHFRHSKRGVEPQRCAFSAMMALLWADFNHPQIVGNPWKRGCSQWIAVS